MTYDQKDFNNITQSLNHVNPETREKCSELFKDKLFIPQYDISIRDQKELSQKRLQKFFSAKISSVKDFLNNPQNIFTCHEMIGYVDGALGAKYTVQMNLFGGTVIGLGTKQHEEFHDKIDNLEVSGCFCLTEVAYGNNAIEMETVAVWDEIKKKFVINTPTVKSQKFWISNGSYYANYCVVFAKTIIRNKNQGINCFIVRLRDEEMKTCKGVVIDFMGNKMGVNGIDNARIIFRNVEVERTAMLNKLADFNEKEEFVSKFESRRQRFIQATNKLLSGRVCISSMMISQCKLILLITIKYANNRLSNGRTGKSDTPISEFQIFQNQIVPLLAKTVILNLSLLRIGKYYSEYVLNPEKFKSDHFNHIVRLTCMIKPLLTWHANTLSNVCRERCGGQAYLSINRIEQGVAGSHTAITTEGDNSILMQKVSKEYVDDFAKGKIKAPKITTCLDKISKSNDVFNIDSLLNLIRIRETSLLSLLTEKTVSRGEKIYDTWMLEESDLIQDLSSTFGERFNLEEALLSAGENKIILDLVLLCASKYVLSNIGWFVLYGYVNSEAAKILPQQINQLIKKIGKASLEICESFGIPKHVIFSPMYHGYLDYYKSDYTQGEHYDLLNLKPKL